MELLAGRSAGRGLSAGGSARQRAFPGQPFRAAVGFFAGGCACACESRLELFYSQCTPKSYDGADSDSAGS